MKPLLLTRSTKTNRGAKEDIHRPMVPNEGKRGRSTEFTAGSETNFPKYFRIFPNKSQGY